MARKTMPGTSHQTYSVEESSTASVLADLETLYSIKPGVFSKIHAEVKTFIRDGLQQYMTDVVSLKTTQTLTYAILDNVMSEVTSILAYLCDSMTSYSNALLKHITQNMAVELVISTANKMQEYWHLCTVSGWIAVSQVSPVNIFKAVDTCLSRLETEALSTFLESLLSICSEGTSTDAQGFGLDTPQCNFIQDVADNIKSSSRQVTSETETPETKTTDQDLNFTEEEHRGECILETILMNCISYIYDDDMTVVNDWIGFEHSWKTLQAEASKLISDVIFKETANMVAACSSLSFPPEVCAKLKSCTQSASLKLVTQLTSELASSISEELAHPSVDPVLYELQVKLVSGKLQKIAQVNLRKTLQTSLIMRSEESLSVHELAHLTSKLLSGSKQVVRSIMLEFKKFLSRTLLKDVLRSDPAREFLESLKQQLEDMYIQELEDTAGLDEETFRDHISADPQSLGMVAFDTAVHSAGLQIPKKKKKFCRFFKIRMPKLKFKIFRRTNRVEPMSDPSTTCTEKRSISPVINLASVQEELSSPLDDSTVIYPPKKKTSICSKISRAFSKVFGKLQKPFVN